MNTSHSRFLIRNCEFKFKCEQQWDSLIPKDGVENLKYCSQCQKDVHLVKDPWELAIAIDKNYCVAVHRSMGIEARGVKNLGKISVGQIGFKE